MKEQSWANLTIRCNQLNVQIITVTRNRYEMQLSDMIDCDFTLISQFTAVTTTN